MTLADLDRVIEALGPAVAALRTHVRRSYVVDGEVHPALVRRYERDMEEADEAREALSLLRQMREGATEVHAWRFGGSWFAGEHYRGATGDIDLTPALLIISPEDG